MDVSPPRLAGRLHQANAKLVVRHAHPHAESPRRRMPLKPRAATGRSAGVGPPPTVVQQGEGAPETGTGVPTRQGGEGRGESQLGASGRRRPQVRPEKDAGDAAGVGSNNSEGGGIETVVSTASTAGGGGDSAGGGVPCGREAASVRTEPGSAVEVAATEREVVSLGDASKVPASEANTNNQDALAGTGASTSPALPGPSPAGISPVWTFEGRTPSNKFGTSGRAIGDSRWTQSKMWMMSNQGHSSGGASTPTRGASLKALAPEDRLREERRALQRRRSGSRSMDSLGHSVGSTAPTGTSSSMREAGAGAAASRGKAFTFPVPRGETDSESDDQLAVRASAFEGGGSVPHVSMPGPSTTRGEQWAMEMQMEFAQERRRWEE